MKISPEDPILIAYALGELDQSSAASVEEAFAKDESLAQEGAAISSLVGLLSETLEGDTYSLGEERRDEIFKAGRRPDAEVLVLDHRRRSRRQSLMAVVGVAAVVVAGFVGLSRLQTSGPVGREWVKLRALGQMFQVLLNCQVSWFFKAVTRSRCRWILNQQILPLWKNPSRSPAFSLRLISFTWGSG